MSTVVNQMPNPMPERDHEHERLLTIVFNISPSQAAALSLLCSGQHRSTEEIKEFTGMKSNPKAIIWHMKPKLEEHGIELRSRRGIGYWMERECREKVQDLLVEYITRNQ